MKEVVVQDFEEDSDCREQKAQEAAHIGEDVEDRVARPLHNGQVHAHLDFDPLEQVFFQVERKRFDLLAQLEDARIGKLGDLVEVQDKVLKC